VARKGSGWSGISTNVRFAAARFAFAALGRVAPGLAAAAAERMFFTPHGPRRSRGDGVLRSARRLRLEVAGRRLAAWKWGQGPAVLLVHGWGGRAAQLSSFVAPLVERGYSAVVFDAPGHGRSGRGLSSAPEFARALRAVADAVGGVEGVVAHSLGAAATALALRDGLAVRRVVFLAPPADPPAWVAPFAARLGVSPEVVERMRRRSENRLGLSWDELKVARLAARYTAPLLVIHDREDAEVPLADGAAIVAAWEGARLVETAGLGHHRLLRDPGVVERTVAFVAREDRGGARCEACGARLASPRDSCARCGLDRELFDRDLRWPGTARPATPA
jgi:pimeloyl-ACP methyl ester carboxylesterase